MGRGVLSRLSFLLRPVPPFRLDFTVWALRRRANNIVDRWDGSTYRRVVLLDGEPAEVEIAQIGTLDNPILRVSLSSTELRLNAKSTVKALVVRMLGLRIDLTEFYNLGTGPQKLRFLRQHFY